MASRLCILLGMTWPSYATDHHSFIQASVAGRTQPRASKFISRGSSGPEVQTTSGMIRGIEENGIVIFKNIPYVESPRRFAMAEPKRPWLGVLNATKFGPGCIGSHTGVKETEDCLSLNIWAPPGERTGMPVIVYFHGGMLQHGSGQESLRQGDKIVQSEKHPVIFVNFDFRLGIFGWVYGDQRDGVTNNLGLVDQQLALQWIQKNIAAFGGDPTRVTLQGQSEGAGVILVHMVAPGSAGLFHRVIFHSPPADIWSRSVNKERTHFMAKRLGCPMHSDKIGMTTIECLRQQDAQKLWGADWVAEELVRNLGSWNWFKNGFGLLKFGSSHGTDLPTYLGWHPVIDNVTLLGEPRDLIRAGKWNKVPVLITVSKNETYGVIPGLVASKAIMRGLTEMVEPGGVSQMIRDYNASLAESGVIIKERNQLLHMILTDKMWTCEGRAMADDIVHGGGTAYLEMFWHSPKFDPVGRGTNAVCQQGATCHAAEMLYSLPQGRKRGVEGHAGMEKEMEFVRRYSEEIRTFAHGDAVPWEPYDSTRQTMTFYDSSGPRPVPGYRREQCAVLDPHAGPHLPSFVQRRAARVRMAQQVERGQLTEQEMQAELAKEAALDQLSVMD